MKYVFKNVNIYQEGAFKKGTIVVDNGRIATISFIDIAIEDKPVFELNDCFLFPGFVDVHVHLREPGFSYKETIKNGTLAAAHGGFTSVCTMPNVNPVPDSIEHLNIQKEIIDRDAVINVYPYGAITVNEGGIVLADMDGLSDKVIGFSDDGKGIQDEEIMLAAMKKAKTLGKIIAAHCEDNSLLNGGYIHQGVYASLYNHRGIPSESEWRHIERDLRLAEQTGCAYHVCHVSCKESVSLIRNAKMRGVDVTCETAPHYLLLNDMQLKDDGRFKMNPPIRSEADRQALIEGICDNTIDMIATDHAPHSVQEKSGGLRESLNGITGLETAFPVLYTGLVCKGIIPLEKLIDLMYRNPSRRFGIGSSIAVGEPASFTIYDLKEEYKIDSKDFLSLGKSSPFDGIYSFGKCLLTMCNGEIVWKDNSLKEVIK
ncbi:dihydroorotase [Lutispora thermophila]|uniref:Dihydroorotase n=1 Tax=Lutispora thermophila DSM 19022 TaxID=1122184 RepID=A0A1M6DP26_9FIRM|nr:dihydroorotase [Lutispora thermophila]SHI74940.1 dihydroorotase [Lutispora thermophila DSM 19022]